jgi:DNA-binding SARP family transcriptional activator/pimeloyl-ACP methyl ester carboxylesterase
VDRPAALELRLIGQLAVFRNGQQVALPPSRKTKALLAYLAATGREHRRERLCAMFWDVPDDPKGSLRWSLSKLRQPFGDRVRADRETVRLDLSDVDVDLARLDALSGEITVQDGSEALRLLSGNFCEGLDLPRADDFQTWCLGLREDVRQAQLRLAERLLQDQNEQPERAVEIVRRAIELDPLSGRWRLALVETLAAAGRSDEAEQQRRLAVDTLSEAGIAPLPALSRRVPEAVRPPAPKPPLQRVQFCTARDGVGLAYSCTGEGPPLVKTANWLNHLEFEWESPIWRHWIRELSRDRMLLRYDERGNGLSDWKVEDLSFEAFVEDLETVVDAAGVETFDLLCISQGCAVGIAYAVRQPQRVRRLVLIGGYSMGWAVRAHPDEVERREAMIALTRTGWGQDNPAFRQMFTTLYFPDATPEQAEWFNELQRVSASPEGAQRLQRALSEIDVRHLLPQVRVPTIVFHARHDAVIPFDSGRYLALPGRAVRGLRERQPHPARARAGMALACSETSGVSRVIFMGRTKAQAVTPESMSMDTPRKDPTLP